MRGERKPKRKYRILIADRVGVFRLGLKKLFALEDDFRVVAQAENAAQVPALTRKFDVDLFFVQEEIAEEGPGDLLARIRQAAPRGKILITAGAPSEDETQRYVRRGAAGVILKSADPASFVKGGYTVLKNELCLPKRQLVRIGRGSADQAKDVARPVDTLTRREKSIISCLLQGWRNREIARHLSITEQTVKNHLRTVFDKVGVSDRLELVLYAIHHRLELPPVSPAPSP